MTGDLIRILFAVAFSVSALSVLEVIHRVMLRAGQRLTILAELAKRGQRPMQLLVGLGSLEVGLRLLIPDDHWRNLALRLLGLGLIGAGAWLTTALLFVVEDMALSRFRTDVQDNRRARTVHTQVILIRRITVVVVAVFAAGSMLVSLPSARAAGASVLASAGVVGLVTALAAQSVLGNLIAGLQIAFGGSLRLDDVVIAEGEWGRIEEITLTYIVVHIWDDRRLILPTSYFTTKPFENWTRSDAALLGTVELDVDWSVPADQMRAYLREVLSGSPLWDKRVSVLQITEATGGMVRVRALMSAQDAGVLWDLRCLVRESLVAWLREHHTESLPRVRTDLSTAMLAEGEVVMLNRRNRPGGSDARMFGGDADGWQRRYAFSGPQDE